MMETYFKATQSDGTDFYTGMVDYAAICGTGDALRPVLSGRCGVCSDTVYHASDVAAETLIGGRWPCRLFEVTGEPADQHGHKFGFMTLRVVREIDAHLALGPNGEAVAALINKCWSVTRDQDDRMRATWFETDAYLWEAADRAAYNTSFRHGRMAARNAIGRAVRSAASPESHSGAFHAAGSAARALVVKDLITTQPFDIMYAPWASVMGGNGS